MNSDCNSFIINNGAFIRDLDSMYANIDDPWDQFKSYKDDIPTLSSFYLVHSLFPHLQTKTINILDIGCANGYHSSEFHRYFPNSHYYGTDISATIINKAKSQFSGPTTSFLVDDCRIRNSSFVGKFNIIFSSKTLYLVSPEIDSVLKNIITYLLDGGLFVFVYNQREDSFSNQFLTYNLLRQTLANSVFRESLFVEYHLDFSESLAVGIYQLDSNK